MFPLEDDYVEYLRARAPKAVYLKPYWGNSGDVLIWNGNEFLLKELGIPQVVDPRLADVILWPGGNPTMWQGNVDGWVETWNSFPDKDFVIAPATFQGSHVAWQQILESRKSPVAAVFARDPESYSNLRKARLRQSTIIGIGHDPAFHLSKSSWVANHRAAATSEYILASFRSDHESIDSRVRGRIFRMPIIRSLYRRYDARVSAGRQRHRIQTLIAKHAQTLPCLTRDVSMMSFELFVETVRRAAEVHTDRLHCMILALLLEKRVFAYRTAYRKLEQVYEHSIKGWRTVEIAEIS